MLHCNMNPQMTLQLSLDDLLAELQHARRRGDLGRLALIAYCDVWRWARRAGERSLADHSAAMFTEQPHASREAFLEQVDSLVFELEQVRSRFLVAVPASTYRVSMLPRPARSRRRTELRPGTTAARENGPRETARAVRWSAVVRSFS